MQAAQEAVQQVADSSKETVNTGRVHDLYKNCVITQEVRLKICHSEGTDVGEIFSLFWKLILEKDRKHIHVHIQCNSPLLAHIKFKCIFYIENLSDMRESNDNQQFKSINKGVYFQKYCRAYAKNEGLPTCTNQKVNQKLTLLLWMISLSFYFKSKMSDCQWSDFVFLCVAVIIIIASSFFFFLPDTLKVLRKPANRPKKQLEKQQIRRWPPSRRWERGWRPNDLSKMSISRPDGAGVKLRDTESSKK